MPWFVILLNLRSNVQSIKARIYIDDIVYFKQCLVIYSIMLNGFVVNINTIFAPTHY